ncbi:MAG: nucleotide sugar dehydrogenase [Halobacteriota archaeon]|nr:nucleotide sugar dehydrogenase [Halobacteriota archaeon]
MKIYGGEPDKIVSALKSGDITVAVYGLGKMGLPIAAVFADRGADVIGVDINEDVVANLNRGINYVLEEPGLTELVKKNVAQGRLSATSDLVGAARRSDVMIVIVPTFLNEENTADLSLVSSVCEKISEGLETGDFVITESTLPPKTTEGFVLPILEKSGLKVGDFGLAHCPERTSSGRAIIDIMGAYPKVVGGVDDKSTKAAKAIYSVINDKGVIEVSNATTAEAVKVFEGVYRDVNIALANQLAIICEEIGIDAIETFNVANTQPYSNLHMPGCGVGGHCIPVYPYFITKIVDADTSLLKLSREINDYMAEYTVSLAERALKDAGRRDLKGSNVLILGVTYRGGVKETRCSPAISIIKILSDKGAVVSAWDPLLKEEVEQFGAKNLPIDNAVDIDAIIVASDHEEFKDLKWEKIGRRMRNKIVVDGRDTLDSEELESHGFVFIAIGH